MNENALQSLFATVTQTLGIFVAVSGGFVVLGRQRLDADRREAQANLRNVPGLSHGGVPFHLRRLAQSPLSFSDRQDRVAEVLVQAGIKRLSADEQEDAVRAASRLIYVELAARQLVQAFWVGAAFGAAGIALSLLGLCVAPAVGGTPAAVALMCVVLACTVGTIAGAGAVLHAAAGRTGVTDRVTTLADYAQRWSVLRNRFERFCRDSAQSAAARADQRWPTGYRRAVAEWTKLRGRIRGDIAR